MEVRRPRGGTTGQDVASVVRGLWFPLVPYLAGPLPVAARPEELCRLVDGNLMDWGLQQARSAKNHRSATVVSGHMTR